jgi:2-haloacid dehalogenase
MPDRWVTFDCYGTLVDWLGGMRAALARVALAQSETLLRAYHELEPNVQAEQPFRRYRDVLTETLARAAKTKGVTLEEPGASVLADTLPDWPVFPDVAGGLEGLRAAGWRLAILSNVDDDLLDGTRKRLPVPIDMAITAEQVGAYKPATRHFVAFRERAKPDVWVHTAQSRFHDMVPAGRLGVPRVWVNRLDEPDPGGAADAVIPGLDDLASTVERVAARRR